MKSIKLGINIDHVATLRQARGTQYPDPLFAALLAEQAGADNITLHLREDRRHIQDHDVLRVKESVRIPLNFEMAITEEMLSFAERLGPAYCCLVPEKREERTTEGGLDVEGCFDIVESAVRRLQQAGIQVALFIAPNLRHMKIAKELGADGVEIHTGEYADAISRVEQLRCLESIEQSARLADQLGLIVDAGHGLNRQNVQAIAEIDCVETLNIGHAIVADALWMGFEAAVREMKQIMLRARG